MQGILFVILVFLAYQVQNLQEKVQQLDDYHISRVNRSNHRITDLEDKLSDLEREVNWK